MIQTVVNEEENTRKKFIAKCIHEEGNDGWYELLHLIGKEPPSPTEPPPPPPPPTPPTPPPPTPPTTPTAEKEEVEEEVEDEVDDEDVEDEEVEDEEVEDEEVEEEVDGLLPKGCRHYDGQEGQWDLCRWPSCAAAWRKARCHNGLCSMCNQQITNGHEDGAEAPQEIKDKIILIKKVLADEFMMERERIANEEAPTRLLLNAVELYKQLPINGLSCGYYLWAAEACDCDQDEMVTFLYNDAEAPKNLDDYDNQMHVYMETCSEKVVYTVAGPDPNFNPWAGMGDVVNIPNIGFYFPDTDSEDDDDGDYGTEEEMEEEMEEDMEEDMEEEMEESGEVIWERVAVWADVEEEVEESGEADVEEVEESGEVVWERVVVWADAEDSEEEVGEEEVGEEESEDGVEVDNQAAAPRRWKRLGSTALLQEWPTDADLQTRPRSYHKMVHL